MYRNMQNKETVEFENQTRVIISGKNDIGSNIKISENVDKIEYTNYGQGESDGFTGYLDGKKQFSVLLNNVTDIGSHLQDELQSFSM